MSKHFYFGSSVFFILFVHMVAAIGANIQTVLVVGLTFLIVMCGMILNELYEQRSRNTAFQDQAREYLEQISFELQLMRDCRFDQMQERTRELAKTLEMLAKLAEADEQKKAGNPKLRTEVKSDTDGTRMAGKDNP